MNTALVKLALKVSYLRKKLCEFSHLIYLQVHICRNLETLKKIVEYYFHSDDLKIETWVCNPFLTDMDSKSMKQTLPKMTSLTLRTKWMMLHKFYSTSLREFCCSLTRTHLLLSKWAMGGFLFFFYMLFWFSVSALIVIKMTSEKLIRNQI